MMLNPLKYYICAACQLNGLIARQNNINCWKCRKCLLKQQDNFSQLPSSSVIDDSLLNTTSSTIPASQHSDHQLYKLLRDTKGLKLCHQNINSIRNKFDDVLSLLVECIVDIIAFTESKLDVNRDHDGMLEISGYNFIRKDRDYNKGGGTLIYIKSELNVEEIDCPIPIFENSEVTILKVNLKNDKPILVVVLYSHPDIACKRLVDFFRELNDFLLSLGLEYFWMGDFNQDILKRDANSFSLFNASKEYGLVQLMQGPTYKGLSLLDHIYSNKKWNVSLSGHFPYSSSDHDLTFIIRKITKPKYVPKFIYFRNYKNCDFVSFNSELGNFEIVDTNNVSSEMDRYNSYFLFLLDKYAPLKRRQVKPKVNPWYSSKISALRKQRDKLRVLADKTNNKSDVKNYRIARNYYNNSVSNAKKYYFKEGFKNSCKDTVSLWNTVNILTGFRKKPHKKVTKLVDTDGEVVIDEEKINCLLANQFVIKSVNVVPASTLKDEMKKYEANYVCNDDNFSPVTVDEINDALSLTKKDNFSDTFVPLTILKKCQNIVSLQLSILFNLILSTFVVPQSFKSTIVTPIYKGKGLRTNPSSFRPISCINVYCKIFERVMFNRLRDRIESKLCNQQHGFRKNRSCHTALADFTNFLYSALNKTNGKAIVIYYDAKSAFDSLDRSILISKLMSQYELHPTYINVLHNYMTDRVFKLKNDNNYYSNPTGIIQGGSICPLLYGAYQNDIVDMIESNFLLYCDDLCVYVEGTDLDEMMDRLKIEADKVQQWFMNNNMNINYVKTKFQIFHKPGTFIPEKYCKSSITLSNGQQIEQVSCMKYLGILFNCTLSFKEHYNSVMTRVSANLGYLYGIKRYLTTNMMSIMISCHVHSIIDYCVDIWAVHTNDQLFKIQSKIDTFIVNFMLPSVAKKMKFVKCKFKNIKSKINAHDLRAQLNLLTLCERRDLFLYKYAYVNLHHLKSVSSVRRSWPLLKKPLFLKSFSQKCINYRATTLWNSLPREWDGKMMYQNFVQKCREIIISKRKNTSISY
jgi:hypothetical protein